MSDSTVIDTLKDDICAALDAYEQRIAARYQEMDTHREAIAALKAELRSVNQRYVHAVSTGAFAFPVLAQLCLAPLSLSVLIRTSVCLSTLPLVRFLTRTESVYVDWPP